MMEYFRKYLISLRRAENDGLFWNLQAFLLIVSVLGIVIGVVMDILLPAGYFSNMFRGLVSIIAGVALFSFSYLFGVKRDNKKRSADRYYKPIRERFSHRQRVNFSIVIGSLLVMFVLLGNNSSPAFTMKATILIFMSLVLMAFSRKLRNEFIKDIHEIPDLRDLEAAARAKKRRAQSDEH